MWFKLYYTTSFNRDLHSPFLFSSVNLLQIPPFSIFHFLLSSFHKYLHSTFFIFCSQASTYYNSSMKHSQLPPFSSVKLPHLPPFHNSLQQASTIASILFNQASINTYILHSLQSSFHNISILQSSFYKYLQSPYLFSQAFKITSILQLSLIKLSQLPPFSIFFNQASKKNLTH